MYSKDALVIVEAFTRQPDGEDVIIGRIETGVFLAVPSEAVEVLDYLAQGKTIGEVSELYQQKYGEIPDLDDFLGVLETKGIVRQSVPDDEAKGIAAKRIGAKAQGPRVRYHFSNLPHSVARRLFSRPILICCTATIILATGALIYDPSLAPKRGDLYFPDRRVLTWTILVAASYLTIFIHELGHLIAARALGVNSRMGISNRLWYLVAETDLTGLWAVPKRQRYLPMVAGALIDLLSASLLLLLLFARNKQWLMLPDLGVRVARGMMFFYLMRIVWQFFLFVRTDFYYVIASLFNCRNLLKDTEGYLRNQLAGIFKFIRPVDQSSIPLSERRIIRAYSILWIAGRIFAFFMLAIVTIPLAIMYLRNFANTFRSGYRTNPSDFLDALLLVAYFVIPLTVGLALWFGGIMRRERT